MKTVVFACVHNAGRSQMAAAWFNKLADPRKARALSAGTEPGERVHPVVVDAMREVGIELEHARPQLLTAGVLADATHLVTMGCGEACPVAPKGVRRRWTIGRSKIRRERASSGCAKFATRFGRSGSRAHRGGCVGTLTHRMA